MILKTSTTSNTRSLLLLTHLKIIMLGGEVIVYQVNRWLSCLGAKHGFISSDSAVFSMVLILVTICRKLTVEKKIEIQNSGGFIKIYFNVCC